MANVSDTERLDEDFNQSTWLSLLGLLNWYEFFISVDQTGLWRKHIAWAKPKGKEIRDYTTQRFSSNMVFLSLLLGATVNVLFSPSLLSTAIRTAVKNEEYGLKYWIGIVMILSCAVSVVALVATFTAWGLINSISDSNSHCLLRSSMGQYVTSLPSRFVVASLYLFLLWLLLLLIDMVEGPVLYVMMAIVLSLFFQVVVSLSAFGRLIIHTGAMGRKRVLDPELERQLLPSGLHASLLIKATERIRRRTSVHTQYSSKSKRSGSSREASPEQSQLERGMSDSLGPIQPTSATSSASSDYPMQSSVGSNQATIESKEAGSRAVGTTSEISRSLAATTPLGYYVEGKYEQPWQRGRIKAHRRMESTDSAFSVDDLVKDINFPNASVLNRALVSKDLRQVVELALSRDTSEDHNNDDDDDEADAAEWNTDETAVYIEQSPVPVLQLEIPSRHERRVSDLDGLPATSQLLKEWKEDDEVREMYNIEPPSTEKSPSPTVGSRKSFKLPPSNSTTNRSFRKHRRWASPIPSLDAIREDAPGGIRHRLSDESTPLMESTRSEHI